jgi:hypothetical protein
LSPARPNQRASAERRGQSQFALGSAAAYVWDLGEEATATSALVSAAIEAAAIAGSFVILGRALGLRTPPEAATARVDD